MVFHAIAITIAEIERSSCLWCGFRCRPPTMASPTTSPIYLEIGQCWKNKMTYCQDEIILNPKLPFTQLPELHHGRWDRTGSLLACVRHTWRLGQEAAPRGLPHYQVGSSINENLKNRSSTKWLLWITFWSCLIMSNILLNQMLLLIVLLPAGLFA